MAERLAALGWLAASISHELTSPLQTILNAAEQLADADLDPAQRRLVDYILNDARRCERTVAALLGLARGEVQPSAPFDLVQAAQEACDLMRLRCPDDAHRLRIEASATPIPVTINPTLLQQMLLNLLNNALQASPHGEVLMRLVGHRIEVIDHGPGISDPQRVFDAFTTTKPPGHGTGLGLSLCRHIVDAFGGRIWIEETPGGGATVLVGLPIHDGGSFPGDPQKIR